MLVYSKICLVHVNEIQATFIPAPNIFKSLQTHAVLYMHMLMYMKLGISISPAFLALEAVSSPSSHVEVLHRILSIWHSRVLANFCVFHFVVVRVLSLLSRNLLEVLQVVSKKTSKYCILFKN